MNAIEFQLNGKPVVVTGVRPTTTLLNWLRYERALTGTKEGCAEGDCGACTVAMRAPGGDWLPTCACILLIGMAHGREIRTVEALSADGTLHPIQQATAESHGTQCGFCTPGFVMSLWAAGQAGDLDTRQGVCDALSGNLCRCTGYGPIVDAALSARVEKENLPGADDPAPEHPLHYRHESQSFWAPTSLDLFAELVAQHPNATIVSGATDIGLWVTKHGFEPEEMIFTGRITALREIISGTDTLRIGAGATYRDAAAALSMLHPGLAPLIRRIGGAQVRAMGTIGGNIANGSPIGDMPPALIAANATICLMNGDQRRSIPLETYFIDYGKQDRTAGEFVEAIEIPLPPGPSPLRCYKIAKRHDQDISTLLGCFAIETDGNTITSARVAFGGMAEIPKRARTVETALIGSEWTLETVSHAASLLDQDFTPISDHRATAAYRMRVARNLLLKYFHELSGVQTVLPDQPLIPA